MEGSGERALDAPQMDGGSGSTEALGATDIVSFNLYRGTTRAFLKPCEMSSAKVARFVLGFQPST